MEDFLVHIVELTKLKPENITKLNELEAWIFMIREAHKIEKDGLKPILEKYPNLEDALLELEFLSSNDELVAIYDARVKAERDYRSRLEAQMELGYNTGLEMGLERGRREGGKSQRNSNCYSNEAKWIFIRANFKDNES
jgi:hypothetical protein